MSNNPSVEQIKLIDNFKNLYQNLNKDTVESGLIEAVYSENMVFKDTFHEFENRSDFILYCHSIYENVIYSKFEFHETMISNEQAMLTWTMHYAHPKLKSGGNIAVKGASHIKFSNSVHYHQDYIDGGELLYEHIPVLSWVIKKLKSRMV